MDSRSVHPQAPSRCPHVHACAASPRAHAPAGLSLRVSLRTPALRWAAAVLVAVAGRCTVIAHMEPLPAPSSAQAPTTDTPTPRTPSAYPSSPLP